MPKLFHNIPPFTAYSLAIPWNPYSLKRRMVAREKGEIILLLKGRQDNKISKISEAFFPRKEKEPS
jgi:hypothetical protein